jgi:YVTN family beta-propeller protein
MNVARIGGAVAVALAIGSGVSAWADGHEGVAYVTNEDGGVTIISLDKLEATGTIDVEAKGPRGIGVTADGKHLITANKDSGDVSVVDTASKKVVKHIAVGKNPEFVRVHGDFAYVTFEPSSKGGPPPKPGTEPKEKEKDDDDAGPKEPAQIAVIDLKEWKVVRTITSGPETEGLEFSPDGKMMLVTNEADNTVAVFDLASGKVVKTIDTAKEGKRPRGVKVSPDGSTYVVTLEYGDKFMVLDKDFNVVKTVPTGKTPYGVAFDRSGKRLFVATSRDKQLQVFDGKTFEPIKKIPTADRCWHFTFTPDDSKILLACGRSHEVLVFDANSYAELKRISGKELPWGVVTYPKAMGTLDAPK